MDSIQSSIFLHTHMTDSTNTQPNPKREAISAIGVFLKETLQTIIFALILTLIIYYFIATPNQVQGYSMMPNIQPNELILTNRFKHLVGDTSFGEKHHWNYQRGQVVIFEQPSKEPFIKRIIALPGDEIEIIEGYLVINGEKLEEKYLAPDILTLPGSFLKEGKKMIVPEDHYVVFGDNRVNSLDSRQKEVGFVDRKDMIGPAEFRLLPINKIGFIPIGEYSTTPFVSGNSNEKINLLS